MEDLKGVAVPYFTLLSLTCYIIIYTYPAGDWVAGPFVIMTIGAPIAIAHITLCILYYTGKKKDWMIWVSGILSLISLIAVSHFLYTH